MYCAKCGHVMEDDMMFCPECGEKVLLPDDNVAEKTVDEGVEREKVSEEQRLTPLVLANFLNQKVDRCLRTGKGKVVWAAILGATVVVVGGTVARGVVFYKNYNWLYQYELNEETVNTLKKEVKTAQDQADEAESHYQELQERYKYLSSYDLDKDWETSLKQQIVELSMENQVLIQQIKADVMNELGYQYTPVYSQREAYDLGLDFRDGLIDQFGGAVEGGSIISSGVKEALNAAAEEASLDNILAGAKKGLADGVSGYVNDKIIGDLGGKVKNIFETTDQVKSTIESMGNVPPEALDQLSDAMEGYVTCMQDFVSKESVTQEDIHEVYQAVCGYRYLNQTLKAMMSDGSQLLDANDVFQAQDIQMYDKNLEKLRKYVEMAEELGS